MAAIVKANTSLTAGNLAVLKRNFASTDSGQMTYFCDYCCLESFAKKWTPYFKIGSKPPTALPANMLLLNLSKTPTLVDLQTESSSGLTYFKATYSAGVESEVTITEESDVRTHSYTYQKDVGIYMTPPGSINSEPDFYKTGEETITQSFEYVSVTVTATSKNSKLPEVKGYVLEPQKPIWVTTSNLLTFETRTIDTFSKTKNSRGEYTYTARSTGVY